MANKAKKSTNNRNMMYGLCAAVVVVIIVVIVAVLMMRNKPIDESFFVSDGTKYVLTMDASSMNDATGEYTPEKVRLVYFYSGEKVTDLKMYYEFENEETAKKAADYLKSEDLGDGIKDVSVNGKYVIATANASAYENMTAEDAKQQVELMESLQNMNFNETVDEDTEINE